jgi:putative sigma-54 modulation protein
VKDAHRVDLTANLKGLTIHCTEESPDMYTSIDAAASALNRKLRKYKERRLQGFHSGNSMGDDLMSALEKMEDNMATDDVVDDFVDPGKPSITKVNSFDLKNGIPLEEAIFALDYVDHDFFVFKNEETDKVTVVYKRNAGGVGLIEV